MTTPLPNPTPVAHDWRGRALVVTGGVRGQGAALAALLLQAGADVHVMDTLPASDPAWTLWPTWPMPAPGTCTAMWPMSPATAIGKV